MSLVRRCAAATIHALGIIAVFTSLWFADYAMANEDEPVDFRVGQIWAYDTRPGEVDSTLTILKIERYRDLGPVIHVRVDGIHMVNPLKGNIVTDIPHIPFKQVAIRRSVTRLLRTSSGVHNFHDGYAIWKKAYLAGEAGAFDIPVRNALDAMLGGSWQEEK